MYLRLFLNSAWSGWKGNDRWNGVRVAQSYLFVNRFTKETRMNRDQVKGRLKEAAGKVQQEAGKATGSLKTQAKGLLKEVEGKVQKNVGDAVNDSKKARY